MSMYLCLGEHFVNGCLCTIELGLGSSTPHQVYEIGQGMHVRYLHSCVNRRAPHGIELRSYSSNSVSLSRNNFSKLNSLLKCGRFVTHPISHHIIINKCWEGVGSLRGVRVLLLTHWFARRPGPPQHRPCRAVCPFSNGSSGRFLEQAGCPEPFHPPRNHL